MPDTKTSKKILDEVQIEDIRWFTPNWRQALKPGRGMLGGRIEEMNTDNLIEPPIPLPDHTTHPV